MLHTNLRLDVFHRIDPRCANREDLAAPRMRSARERVTNGALLDAPSPEGEAAKPGSGFTLRRSRVVPTASQRSSRARPARASPAPGHDELGHPHPPSRTTRRLPWQGFLTRVGAGGAVTPVTFRPTSATHDFVYKERVPRCLGPLRATSHAARELSDSRPRSSLRRAGESIRSVSSPLASFGVPLTLRRQSPRPPHDVRRCSEHGPPTERNVRRCRPVGHAK